MSQFFVTYTLLLIQSIGIFVLCRTGVVLLIILPLIFKPACTVQSAKLKLFTNLLPEVLLPSLIWLHKETEEKLLRRDSEDKTDNKNSKKRKKKRKKERKSEIFKPLPGKQKTICLLIINLHFVIYRYWAHFINSDICLLVWFFIFV